MEHLPNYASYRFLIVDDEPFMLGAHVRMLKMCQAGFIETARDGASALRAIKDGSMQIDCIITDFDMKPMNGLQLLSAIRLGVNPLIPRGQRFIMLTGNADADVVEAARALDVNGFIVKPVTPDVLCLTINQVLHDARQLRAADAYRTITLPISSLA
jgi:DNA-binding NarL/FixJ family response regulator